MDISFRQATNSDLEISYIIKKDAIQSYIEETWGWDENWQLEYHNSHFDPKVMQIIESDCEPIGTVKLIETKDINWSYINVKGLYILEKYNSRDLLYKIIKQIRNSNHEWIKSPVFKVNVKEMEYYSYLGFEIEMEDATHYYIEHYGRFNNECPRCRTLLLNYPPSLNIPNVTCTNPNCSSKSDKRKCPKCGSSLYIFHSTDDSTFFTCINCSHDWNIKAVYS